MLGLKAELGDATVAATIELTDDPVLGSFQVAAVGPFGPVDQQRVLTADTAADRLDLLSLLLADEALICEQRLASG